MTEYATDRQTNYIMSLASQIQRDRISYLSQIKCIHLTQREKTGGMTGAEASYHIKELKRRADKVQLKNQLDTERDAIKSTVEALSGESLEKALTRIVTVKGAAKFCGVTPATFRKWVRNGRAPEPAMLDASTAVWDTRALKPLQKRV